MHFFPRAIYKISVNHKIRNVRSKFTKAAVLKTPNEPLVMEDYKIADKLKEGQVSIINNLLFSISNKLVAFSA